LERQFDHLAAYFNTDTGSLTPPAVESEEATIFFDADHDGQEIHQEIQQDAQSFTPQAPTLDLEVDTQSLHPPRQCPRKVALRKQLLNHRNQQLTKLLITHPNFKYLTPTRTSWNIFQRKPRKGRISDS